MENEERLFTCKVSLGKVNLTVNAEGAVQSDQRAIAMIGDTFYNGDFIAAKEIEKSLPAWEGTLHDINHKGTGYKMGGVSFEPDITFFVGWNSNAKFNSDSKTLSMDINIAGNTQYAAAWKGYVELCELSGQTPNVSVSFYGRTKRVRASDLPEGTNYKAYGYSAEDMVWSVYDIRPVALSTVFHGACSDADGCGINKCSCESSIEEPTINIPSKEDEEKLQKEKDKIVEWLKNHE